MNYGKGTAFVVGMVHGIGAETPTQVLIFLTAVTTGGKLGGEAVLLTFIVGLLMSNTLITFGSSFGFLRASRNWKVYVTVAILTGTISLVIGLLFLFGEGSVPAGALRGLRALGRGRGAGRAHSPVIAKWVRSATNPWCGGSGLPRRPASAIDSASSRPQRWHVRCTCWASSRLWYSAPDSRWECCNTPTSSSSVSVR